jgi:hypothetical protein
MPTLLTPPPLESVLQQLHDSEINAGVQTFYDAGMRVWIGDEVNGIQAETTINRTAAARLKWPEGFTAASWLHETALRLYPERAASRSDGSPSTTWAWSRPMRPASPPRLKGIGSSFPAACTC